jgi:hypothetical protein
MYIQNERYLWIDALCINQEDIDERNHQVTRMGEIYNKAARVTVLLGPASEDNNIGFEFLMDASTKRLDYTYWMIGSFQNPNTAKYWRAVYRLADRDYWRRVWIVQEIFFAKPLIVCYGFRCLRWSDYLFLFHAIMEKRQWISEVGNARDSLLENQDINLLIPMVVYKSENIASIAKWKKPTGEAADHRAEPLEKLLMAYRTILSSDLRDKVFGIAGMALQYEGQLALKIHYTLEKRDVYINTM